MDLQRTIGKDISCNGVGLHTGNKTTVTFKPAAVNSGVTFVRVDVPGKPEITADISAAVDAPRRTTLRKGDVEVHTVEHILAALGGIGLDNLIIEVDACEVPEIDGSSLPFVKMFAGNGLVEQEAEREYFRVTEPIYAAAGDGSYVAAFPADDFRISFTIDYDHPYLGTQFASFQIIPEVFEKEIASARTFCLEREADALRAQGLGKGANFQNTVVIGNDGIVKGKLRFNDEFVRHKVLDLMGDMFLIGKPLKAHVVAMRSGHSLNMKFVKKVRAAINSRRKLPVQNKEPGEIDEQLLDVESIRDILPHRYPFLLVDRILEMEKDKRIVGIKNVTINEPFFTGHFPGRAIMPGVLIIEALAQTAGVLMLKKDENRGKLAYLAAIDKVKLRKPVVPGDQLRLEIKVSKLRSRTGKIESKALVDGKVVAEAELIFSLVEA